MTPKSADTIELTIGHSSDADDAFMWWPLGDQGAQPVPAPPVIDTGRFRFRAVPLDIEELNERAAGDADLDITAISMHNLPHVASKYALTHCGASMGDGYGPKLVVRPENAANDLTHSKIAVPGLRTTAYLTLRLMLGDGFTPIPMPFDRIMDAVVNEEADAGLVIHEGQLTFESEGLVLVADLGDWWKRETGMPLPLGANAIRRDLDDRFGKGTLEEVSGILERSIRHAMEDRPTGIEHAMRYAQGIPQATADRFISMYVNDLTIDMGTKGGNAVRELLGRGTRAGLCPDLPGSVGPLIITPESV